ncbi:murein biosynthesis integral membrane protein MurJ [Pseudolysinimonas sp.]|uniref:murein biosynthesis integral membrane protein MurJ n=1 Tax=Pseudolysinimonas sp. TaxID=2680009 RepID=UPI003F81847E
MTTPAAAPAPPPTRMGRASVLLASGTIVSRVLGFISAFALTTAIGLTNPGANAFAVANTLPNLILPLVSGGLLSATLVPAIVRAAKHEDGGGVFVSRLVTLGTTAFLVVTIIVVTIAPLLVGLYTAGGHSAGNALGADGVALTLAMSYWCLPQLFFYALFALLGEVLNARGVFGPVTWVPAINNVVVIATLVLFRVLFGADPARAAGDWTPAQIALLAGGATLGVAVQTVVLALFWRRTGLRFRIDFRWRGLGHVGRIGAWTFGMVLITLAAGIVQTNIALTAGRFDPGTAVIRTAWLIYILPHSIVVMSIATAFYSRMSAHARDGRLDDLRHDVSAALRQIGLLITGAAVALGTAAIPFAGFFSQNRGDLTGTAAVLLAYLPGLLAYGVIFVLQRAFFALGDTRTPFWIQLLQGVLFSVLAFGLLAAPGGWVAIGIAIATTIAGVVQTLVSALVLRGRMGGIDGRRLVRRLGTFAVATIPAALVGLLVLWLLGGLDLAGGVRAGSGFAADFSGTLPGRFGDFVAVVAVGGVTALVYVAVLLALRVPELDQLIGPIRRILRRR